MTIFKFQRAMQFSFFSLIAALSTVALAQVSGQDQEPGKFDANAVITEFSRSWDESAWENEFRTTPEKYMRSKSNDDWQLRMRTLQVLVQHSEESIDPLLEALDSDSMPVRVLAAQTLGFLNSDKAFAKLLEVAKTDKHPTVRLYAIDSYGMLGGKTEQLEMLLQSEKNRDAKLHVNYAIERAGTKLDEETRETLSKWDSNKIASAMVGEQAPDFTLETANGGKVSLAEFKGKSAVVLVFIYGDT